MANLIYFILLGIILAEEIIKIDKEHIETLKQVSQFEVFDYEEHPFKDWTINEIKSLIGTIKDNDLADYDKDSDMFIYLEGDEEDLPKFYDIRQVYPECVLPAKHQRKCSACWAFVTSQMLSYKLCISTGGSFKEWLSVQDLVSCNLENYGCENSYAVKAWDYMIKEGIVTEQCLPYTSHNGLRGKCPFLDGMQNCKAGNFKKYKAKSRFYLRSINAAKQSIIEHGPIHALMQIYKDFISYKGGVYKKTPDAKLIGNHSVMILGWGVQGNTQYWIGVNSMGSRWGVDGFFRIAFGECDIESGMWSGTADLEAI
jgi:cathepsin B